MRTRKRCTRITPSTDLHGQANRMEVKLIDTSPFHSNMVYSWHHLISDQLAGVFGFGSRGKLRLAHE